MDLMARMTQEQKDENERGAAALAAIARPRDLCVSCDEQGTGYGGGPPLCDYHAIAQGITPERKQEDMTFGQGNATQMPAGVGLIEPDGEPRSYERLSVTFKHGISFDEPWIVFKGDNVDEVGEMIQEFRRQNGFADVAAAAAEFRGASAPIDAVMVVQQSMPGAQEIAQVPPAYAETRAPQTPVQPVQQQGVPPQQGDKPCHKCGAPAKFASGTSRKTGKAWAHFKCSTGNDDHIQWVS